MHLETPGNESVMSEANKLPFHIPSSLSSSFALPGTNHRTVLDSFLSNLNTGSLMVCVLDSRAPGTAIDIRENVSRSFVMALLIVVCL